MKYICAKAPCVSCPYRKDVPSGVWAANEYSKLPDYDGTIIEQLCKKATAMFFCHQNDGQLCAGWVGTHDAKNLVSLRLHSEKVDDSVWTYKSPVALFKSGSDAAKHGLRALKRPGARAKRIMSQITRKRTKAGGKV